MLHIHRLISCFFFLFFATTGSAQNSVQEISSGWQFRKVGDTEWLPATVPGTVHTDLLANKKIADPFWGTNEKDLQWIENTDWEYRTVFSIDEKMFRQQNIELGFDGLDTYAKVFLNDSLILSADNMFRTWKADIKKYLKQKDNVLLIHFESAVKKGKDAAKKLPYTLPGDERVFARKAAYQYGWDWGPRFVTCGVWRPVKITGWDNVKIIYASARHKTFSGSDAVVECSVEINSTISKKLFFETTDLSQTKHLESMGKDIEVRSGNNRIFLSFSIHSPKNWWCNGLGDQNLYAYAIRIWDGKNLLDSVKVNFGLRTIELVQKNDSIGKSFYFKLNGTPVFMKGANWIPADNFLPRVTRDKYRQLLTAAKDAGMNMLRVWGGGVYESDDFYSLCDSLGILVWQDFMFANAMYPGDAAFLKNVKAEAADNVKRLINHPCIALWCGNNEIDEGWNNWGWQKQYHYSKSDSIKIWHDYIKIFAQIFPTLDPLFPSPEGKGQSWGVYIPTSPLHGWGRKESLTEGDCHYWGVWWGTEPFEMYQNKTGRFMSEYGFQGMPPLNTFRKFCDEKDLSLQSPAVKNHQKHPKGFETIQTYLERDYQQPKDFESYIYVSQVLQAQGIKMAIEEHRRNKPYCMGTLYWQLNDCWPVTSWSSIDYYGNKKALYYTVKKAYSKYSVSAPVKNNQLYITAVSDDTIASEIIQFKIQEIDFNGNHIWRDSGNIFINDTAAAPFYTIPMEDLTSNISTKRVFFKFELIKDRTVVADNVFYFVKPKDLYLDKASAEYSIQSTATGPVVTLSSNTLLKNVFIDFGDLNVSLSDNFFDLLPNETKTVSVLSNVGIEQLKEKIKIKSLIDSY